MQPRQRPPLQKQRLNRSDPVCVSLAPQWLRRIVDGANGCIPTTSVVRRFMAATVLLHAALSTPVLAAPAGSTDLAEFIVNIARYANWPADPSRLGLTLCYSHGGALAPMAIAFDPALTIKGQPLAVRQITSPAQTAGCNMLWINSDARPAPRQWLTTLLDRPVLTLSNYADFTADGGVIGAYRIGDDWRFEINLEALQRSRITIAAAALRLSQRPGKANRPVSEPR